MNLNVNYPSSISEPSIVAPIIVALAQQPSELPMPMTMTTLTSSSSSSSSSFQDDLIAGSTLLVISSVGILLHLVEMVAMCQLVRKVIGFRFFLFLSCADISLLLIFGTFPGWIILSKHPGFLTAWGRQLHIWADTCWFSMCYLNFVIAVTRFACVVFPLQFRRLRRQRTCWLICGSVWLLAFGQSWLINNLPWFVVLWYDPNVYGMTCDMTAYAESGTRSLYLILNLLVIGSYLLIYITTALTIFFKRNIRFQFLSTVCTQGRVSSSVESHVTPLPAGPGYGSVDVPEEQRKGSGGSVMVRAMPSNGNHQQHLVLMRTISVIKGNGSHRARVRGSQQSTNSSSGGIGRDSSSFGSHYSLEVRLVIPCCVNSLIFIIAQLVIIRGGIGTGNWAGFSVMLIFCIQSIAPPLLRFTFSDVLRDQILLNFGSKGMLKRRFRLWAAVATLMSRQH